MRSQQFQKFHDISVVQPERIEIVVPTFLLSVPVWAGASTIIAEYPINNTDYYFSLKMPVKKFGFNFMAAIRWITGNIVNRFKFWEDTKGLLYFPLYNGEKIGLNAILEIWSVNSLSAPELDDNYTLFSSVLIFPESATACCCCAVPGAVITLAQTAPTLLLPYAYCNPFCDNLNDFP